MTGKKAVLNVTVDESVAEAIRQEAAFRNVTISSIVEAALAEQIRRHQIRMAGLAAIDEEYQESGYPTAEEEAAAHAVVEEQMRILAEMRAAEDARYAGHPAAELPPAEYPHTHTGTGAA